MQDDETKLAFDAAFDATLEGLFDQAREQVPQNPELVARVIAQASRRLLLRRRVLLGAVLAAMVCCALLLAPALSVLTGIFNAWALPGLASNPAAMLQSPYLLAVAMAALYWMLAFGAEPG